MRLPNFSSSLSLYRSALVANIFALPSEVTLQCHIHVHDRKELYRLCVPLSGIDLHSLPRDLSSFVYKLLKTFLCNMPKLLSVDGDDHCCHGPTSNWETNQASIKGEDGILVKSIFHIMSSSHRTIRS